MAPSVIVVMGVSGSGKTTVAAALARRLGWEFAEGDAFHPAANVAKMRSGVALTDADRWPWLDAIAAWIRERRAAGARCVIACSALRRAYRERIAGGSGEVRFVYLKGPFELIAARIAARRGHYMPASLLRSQFDTLEEPGTDENPLVVSVERPADEIIEAIIAALQAQ
ncbi:MAG TPA: gluconokinase [Usitatibacter sp.]|nr:gluconokinase [Usitatibacter sp.]